MGSLYADRYDLPDKPLSWPVKAFFHVGFWGLVVGMIVVPVGAAVLCVEIIWMGVAAMWSRGIFWWPILGAGAVACVVVFGVLLCFEAEDDQTRPRWP